MKYNLGSYVAIIGIAVAVLSHFGIILDAQQVGQTVNDGITFVSDLAVIYGVIHQFFKSRQVAKVAGLR